MTDDLATHHLGRGVSFEQQGDLVAAEREYSLADKAGSADGAQPRGAPQAAWRLPERRAAYRRSEAAVMPASCNLAVLLEDRGDVEGAAAYRRADERDFPGGAYGIGQLLYAEGDIDGSIAANRRRRAR